MSDVSQVGSGNFVYEFVKDWENMPTGYSWPETAGVITDNKDNVYVFNRGEHPMMVFDSDGNFIKSWGEGVFVRPHGLSLGPDDTIYCTDDGDHTVRQCTLEGEVLMTIGTPGNPSDPFSGRPFNRCTHTASDPKTGDIFVTDGYGNSRIHKYSIEGQYIESWGNPGVGESEFNIVHNIASDKEGYLYVCDRENHRIQVFDRYGKFEAIWTNVHRPCAIYIDEMQNIYVAELGYGVSTSKNVPNIGPRISVLDSTGRVLERIGHHGYGVETGQFIAPHGLCLDSNLDIYVAEVARTNISHFMEPPDQVRSFQKLRRIT
jgi:DNA-binding beta-propeller fold protein YncE